MHRSGTSAVTGALGHLGLSVPVRQDRWDATEDNPDYWESAALGLFNEALLERLQGRWDGPPEPEPGWESGRALAGDGLGEPAVAAWTAFPGAGPVVWKDPRVCLLLPYWLPRLPAPVVAVFVWRSPLTVARSLRARDGMDLSDGVALWERYNRAALSGLLGVDTFVVRYEAVVAEPVVLLAEVARWLGALPQLAPHAGSWDVDAASAAISARLQRQRDSDDAAFLLDEQRSLVAYLESLEGPHRPLQALVPGDESAWATALLGARRRVATLTRARDALGDDLELAARVGRGLRERLDEAGAEILRLGADLERTRAELAGERHALAAQEERCAQMEASTSWRITGPLRRLGALRHPLEAPQSR
jgi:hypothetical protein